MKKYEQKIKENKTKGKMNDIKEMQELKRRKKEPKKKIKIEGQNKKKRM